MGVKARCINNGQSCIAAKRFIVHQDVADVFERCFAQEMEALSRRSYGRDDRIGPLAMPRPCLRCMGM